MKLKVVQWVLALLLLAPCTQAQSIWDATHLANVKQSIHEPSYATAAGLSLIHISRQTSLPPHYAITS